MWVGREDKIDNLGDKTTHNRYEINTFGDHAQYGENKSEADGCAKCPCDTTNEVITDDFIKGELGACLLVGLIFFSHVFLSMQDRA